jgi:hypothetical protein
MTATCEVIDVYGDRHIVDRAALESEGRTQIPLYTKSGVKLADYYASMKWWGKCTTIHRENIARVLP